MPRIQMTAFKRFVLWGLVVYVIFLLILILIKFLRVIQ